MLGVVMAMWHCGVLGMVVPWSCESVREDNYWARSEGWNNRPIRGPKDPPCQQFYLTKKVFFLPLFFKLDCVFVCVRLVKWVNLILHSPVLFALPMEINKVAQFSDISNSKCSSDWSHPNVSIGLIEFLWIEFEQLWT